MPGAIDDLICSCLSRVYTDHMTKTDRLTCTLEHHALPIRHTFFRLKRVPHFQTRDDLHGDHSPAYNPIYRLENASLESLSQKTKAGCRRVLIEGDLGTGKTLVCHRLLHEWAKAMQFFRNVNLENPRITIADDQGDTNRHPQNDADAIPVHALSEVKHQMQHNMQAGSDRRYDKTNVLSKSEYDCNISVVDSGNNKDNDLTVGMAKRNDNGIRNENGGKGMECDHQKECNMKVVPDEEYCSTHQSRKALHDTTKPRGGIRERSRSSKSSRKDRRSRSTSETKVDGKSKRRNKDKYICDSIPQKYLSLLNMASPGEGSFESPGISRSRTLRETRRQRPSRLTSNLTDYKAMIYIPCVRLALSELLSKCNKPRARHYYVAASVLFDMLAFSNMPPHPLSFDVIYHWIFANRDDICIIFDNVDASEVWERLITDAYHDVDGFGKIIVATTPGRIFKRDVDSLFYCYGLSTDYSNKIITSRLKREAPSAISRIQFLLSSSHTQELLCNPLSLSLMSAYFRSVKDEDKIPEHLSELLEHLIQQAMAHEGKAVQSTNIKGKRRRFSLQSVCETVAFECLENDTNYFSKQKFPFQFWSRHLCDCRVLHEVHEIANFGPIHEQIPSPTATNPSLTPDSDSIHSSSSSILDLNNYCDVSSGSQILASDDHGKDPTNQDISTGTPSDNESPAFKSSLSDAIQPTTSLLQVPTIHGIGEPSKKCSERPKTLSIDIMKHQGKSNNSQENQTNSEIVSFTSRCIRDFLASKRVCRYLQSDRDSEAFVQKLIAKPQFYPVLRLTVRSLYISERSDLILHLLDMLLTSQELSNGLIIGTQSPSPSRGVSPVNAPESPLRGRLRHKYRLSSSDCPFRAKIEEDKQRRSSTSVLGTSFGGTVGLNTSSSFNRFLNKASLTPYSPSPTIPESSRGYLEDFKEALIWLAETDNSEPYIGAVSNRFPDVLIISYQDCPSETIEHFICLVKRSTPAVKEVVLYMSGLYTQWDLGVRLAETLQDLQSISVVNISMKCVVETAFLVDFICECFENNEHIETLRLEGPMNVAENMTPSDHKRVQKVFKWHPQKLKTLMLDHFSYHHRVGYILNCWPSVFTKLEIKRSNLDSVSENISSKLSKSSPLESLSFDNCYMPSTTLKFIIKHISNYSRHLKLSKLQLTLLSSSRRFTKTDARKPCFKPTINCEVCQTLAEMIVSSHSLKELSLTYNGISTGNAKIILQSATRSCTLNYLDLTGNLIGNEVENDVIMLIKKHPKLTSLLLGDNNITKETKSAIIKESLSHNDLRLSL